MTFSPAQNVYIWRKPDIFNVVEQGGVDFTGREGCADLFKKFIEGGISWLKVPSGRYFVDKNALITLRNSFVLESAGDAEFFCDGLQGDFFRFVPPTGGVGLPAKKIDIVWAGPYFDKSRQKNSVNIPYSGDYPGGSVAGVGGTTAEALSFRGQYVEGGIRKGAFGKIEVAGRFFNGTRWLTAGGDSDIFIGEGCDFVVIDTQHEGTRDAAIYLSAGEDGAGANAKINVTAKDCFYGVASKRSFRETDIHGYFTNCVGGVSINKIVADGTKGARVRGTFDRCNMAVRADQGCDGGTFKDSVVRNLGATTNGVDRVTLIPPLVPVAFFCQGAKYWKFNDNEILDLSPEWAGQVAYAAFFQAHTENAVTVASSDNEMAGNTVVGLRGPAIEVDGETFDNFYFNNRLFNCVLPGVVIAATSRSEEWRWNSTAKTLQLTSGGLLFPNVGADNLPAIGSSADPTSGFGFDVGPKAFVALATSRIMEWDNSFVRNFRPVLLPAGTAAAPAIGFSADVDGALPRMGFYRAGVNRLGLAVNGVPAVIFSASGMESIGPVASPLQGTVAAAGTVQGDATAVTGDTVVVTTCPANAGIRLRALSSVPNLVGSRQKVVNATSVNLKVYPATGQAIGELTANLPFIVFPGETVIFDAIAAAQWWPEVGAMRVAGKGGTKVDLTGTTSETAFATIPLPFPCLGVNGQIRVTWKTTATNNANSKTTRVRLGGIGGTNFQQIAVTTSFNTEAACRIALVNSRTVQVGGPTSMPGGWGSAAGSIVNGAVNLGADSSIVISGELANAADTLSLLSYLVEIFP